MNQTPYIPEQDPSKAQTVTSFEVQIQTFRKLTQIEEQLNAINEAMRTQTQTLAAHIKQNIDTFQSMQDYIGDQMRYRTFRQEMEENNLAQQLAQKNLELDFAEKKLKSLEDEDTDADKLRLEFERQRLEIEFLKKNIDILQTVRKTTHDRIPSVKASAPPSTSWTKAKEVMFLTAVGTVSAASVTGVIAFLVWLFRFYIENGLK